MIATSLRLVTRRADSSCSKYTWKTLRRAISIIASVIGDELRKARLAAGLSQEKLGFMAKISRNYVSMVELNQNSPTLETLFRMCDALNISAADLVANAERQRKKRPPPSRH